MGALSLLGKSKTARSLLLAGWIAQAAVPAAFAQSVKNETGETCSSIFKIAGCETARYFPGIDLEVEPVPGRCYRNDGLVKSVKEHFIKLEKETDFYPINREYVLSLDGIGGLAFHLYREKGEKEYRLTIVSCFASTPKENADCGAHEDMHAVRFLFSGNTEAYEKLGKRFENKGFRVNFSDFDSQEQSYIAGMLRLMEHGMPLDEGFLEPFPERKKAYEKLQRYRIEIDKPFW